MSGPPTTSRVSAGSPLHLGDVAGLTQFGVNLTRLPPGCWSSQRHWHTGEDEFVFVVEGDVVLVTDAEAEMLRAGDCVGFQAGIADGHHLQNRSDRNALLLEVGSRRPDEDQVFYPDIDLQVLKGRAGYTHKNGEPYTGSNHATRPRVNRASSFLLSRYRHAVDGENRPIRYAGGHSFTRIEESNLSIEAFRRRIGEDPQFSPPVLTRQPNDVLACTPANPTANHPA